LSEECLNAEHVDVALVENLYVDVMLQLVVWLQLEKWLFLVPENLRELVEVLLQVHHYFLYPENMINNY